MASNIVFSSVALTWRVLYIGSASDPQFDQVLEEAEMDCSNPGQMKFVFEVCLVVLNQLYHFTNFWLHNRAKLPIRRSCKQQTLSE